MEAHRAFARRIMTEAKPGKKARIQFAYRAALARKPRPSETETIERVFDEALNWYRSDSERAIQMATEDTKRTGESNDEDFAEIAA